MSNIKRDIKKLDRKTGRKTTIKIGIPHPREGQNGDITLRKTPIGNELFAKIDGLWYGTVLNAIEGAVKNSLHGKVSRDQVKKKPNTGGWNPTSTNNNFNNNKNTKGIRTINDIVSNVVLKDKTTNDIVLSNKKASQASPNIKLINNTAGGTGVAYTPTLQLIKSPKDGLTAMQDNDSIGLIAFLSDDSSTTDGSIIYGTIRSTIKDVTNSTKDSKMEFSTWENNSFGIGLTLEGNNVSVLGDLSVGGDLTVNGNNINFDASHSYISVGDRTGTDEGGHRLIFEAGQGTGTGVGGSIYFKTSLAGGSSNDTVNSLTDIVGIHGSGDIAFKAASKLLFDAANGAGHTYIQETSDDVLNIYVGGDQMLELSEASSKISMLENFKLYFDGAGEANYIYSDSSNIVIGSDGSDKFSIDDTDTKMEQTLKIKESAAATSDTAAYGQVWVKNSTPNKLMFTDDAGTDIALGAQFYKNCGWYQANSSARYLPIASGQSEQSALIDYANDDAFFIVPFDLKITKVYINITRQSSGQSHPGSTTLRLYKNGSALSGVITVDINASGYDSTDLYNPFTFDFSATTNDYSAGDIMQVRFDPTNTVYYGSATVTGYYT